MGAVPYQENSGEFHVLGLTRCAGGACVAGQRVAAQIDFLWQLRTRACFCLCDRASGLSPAESVGNFSGSNLIQVAAVLSTFANSLNLDLCLFHMGPGLICQSHMRMSKG